MDLFENLKSKLNKNYCLKIKNDVDFDDVVKELGLAPSKENPYVYEKELLNDSSCYFILDEKDNVADLYLKYEWYNNIIGSGTLAELFKILSSGYFEVVLNPLDAKTIKEYNDVIKQTEELKKLFEDREAK